MLVKCVCGNVWNLKAVTAPFIGKRESEKAIAEACPKCGVTASLLLFNEDAFLWEITKQLWERGIAEKDIGIEISKLISFIRDFTGSVDKTLESQIRKETKIEYLITLNDEIQPFVLWLCGLAPANYSIISDSAVNYKFSFTKEDIMRMLQWFFSQSLQEGEKR